MSVAGLTIRRAEGDDCVAMAEMFTSPKVYPGTLQLPYPSKEYWRRRLTENPDSAYHFVALSGDSLVGMFGIYTFPDRPRRRHAGVIAICVHEEWQGKGVGGELMRAMIDFSDNWLNLKRLELEVFADNQRAIHLYERFGFEVEGTMRQHALRDGKYVDSLIMARLNF